MMEALLNDPMILIPKTKLIEYFQDKVNGSEPMLFDDLNTFEDAIAKRQNGPNP